MPDPTTREEVGRGAAANVAHLAGAIVVASVVAVDPGGWYPFGPTKWFLVSTLVAATSTYALAVGVRPRLPRWLWIVWAVFLGWTALCAVFGRDPLYSWTGTPERHLGVVAWVLFAACFAIGSMLDPGAVARWMRWSVVGALWCGGYAVVEWWFGPPIETTSHTSRLGGPFGSAAYLGAALCLLVPIAAGVALAPGERRGWRVVAGIAAVTGTVALVGSGSRAAWIGVLVAAAVAAVAIRPNWRTALIVVGAAVVCVAVMAPRLDDVVERPVSSSSRFDEWALATRVVGDHAVLGLGPEGYRTSLADGVTAHYERTFGREVLPDRAHSAPLDVATTSGIPGALMYLALVGGIVIAALRRLRSDVRSAAIAIGVIAYLVQQVLLFPLAEIDPILWLAAGVLVALPDPVRIGRRNRGTTVATVAAGVITIVFFVTGVLGVAADRAAGEQTLVGARRAADLRPDVVRYHLLVAALAAREGTLDGIDESIDATQRALDMSPHDPIALQAAARALSDRALATGQSDDVGAARDAWQALVADDPLCFECELGLGSAAALAGDAAAAERAWRAAETLAPDGDTRAADALARLANSTNGQP